MAPQASEEHGSLVGTEGYSAEAEKELSHPMKGTCGNVCVLERSKKQPYSPEKSYAVHEK